MENYAALNKNKEGFYGLIKFQGTFLGEEKWRVAQDDGMSRVAEIFS